uniref:Uncharacterized protein ycf23 n=1 Tax=Pleonosporium borreri TaxID=2575635 RepID=A0A4D6WYV9_9FLOR|nr:hypothetical protein [Pleonosporium borreri]
MNLFNKKLSIAFSLKNVIKIILGLNNKDINNIIQTAKAAELISVTYLDIIANPKVVALLKSMINLPVCVSSIDPLELYNCILMGADIVELGNFDIFYGNDIIFSAKEILELAIETRRLIPNNDICITIPHHLSLSKQINLAKHLSDLSINIIQTEGYSSKRKIGININDNISYATNKASSSLSSTYAITQEVNIPVISSSGLSYLSSGISTFYGSSGVGICSSIKKYTKIYDILYYIKQILYVQSSSLNYRLNNQSCILFYNNSFKLKLKQYQIYKYY